MARSYTFMARETDRFAMRCEVEGSWMVSDVFTGWPAEHMGRPLQGLDERTATNLCTVVNALDKHRRRLESQEREDLASVTVAVQDTRANPFRIVGAVLSWLIRLCVNS
ncbi:hypothetical protein A6U87_05820 [Rhizobium sp. AC44/96]|uniref:hypothetical protein n=1 Tax=unclassified Rhizobium TaxID=2613769 RepID=UPI00080FB47C|nr:MULTISPECIES: hypothetical protein [unclassified Rhizobium]MDM9623311.1 hypothetical protein [Rhizobium sp. S96]OCJ12832.1 hypothetical protein A6U87_05820 [Rhizobium sp. AC44/96]